MIHFYQNKPGKVPLFLQSELKNNDILIKQNDHHVQNDTIKKEVENLIYILIDMKKINKKLKEALKKGEKYEKYYPLFFYFRIVKN